MIVPCIYCKCKCFLYPVVLSDWLGNKWWFETTTLGVIVWYSTLFCTSYVPPEPFVLCWGISYMLKFKCLSSCHINVYVAVLLLHKWLFLQMSANLYFSYSYWAELFQICVLYHHFGMHSALPLICSCLYHSNKGILYLEIAGDLSI